MLFITLLALLAIACGAAGGAATPAATAEPTPVAATAEVSLIANPAPTAAAPAQPAAGAISPTPSAAAAVDVGLQQTLIDLYEQANPSVVLILVPTGSGSGFVYDGDGAIVTNNHVVAGSNRFEVVFAGGERRLATLVGADADADLAVLRVAELPEGVEPLPLAEPGSLRVGEFVVAIGNPFGEQGSMSLGIVSGLGRSLTSQRAIGGSSYSLPDVIQTDAPINPGNSGGPLLNLAGDVVGVNAAIASTTGTNSGVGFAIPVSAIRLIVPGLAAGRAYDYPYMGASFDGEVSLDEQTAYGLEQTGGAYVVSVSPGSPAADAGLRAANANGRGGDLVIAVDDQPVSGFADLNSYLVFHSRVGQTIELTVLRDGAEATLMLTLGERP
jgi:2-alkenal reductase